MPDESRGSADYHQIFAAIYENMAREDSNIGERVTWAISLSAGLFAAIAFMTTRINDFCNGAFWAPAICLGIAAVAGLALFFSLKSLLGVRAAQQQIIYLRDHYRRHREAFDDLGLPRPHGDESDGWGLESSQIFPRVLIAFWSIILAAALVASVITLVHAAMHPHQRCASVGHRDVEYDPAG